ncbi:MAG: hypothetical protein K8S87_11985 [Planctomycetes bacterium]|nr:hypothetical protein [Planctomycetota bacterium]
MRIKLSKRAFINVRNRTFIRIMIITKAKTNNGERISENSKARKTLHNATKGRSKNMKYIDSVRFFTIEINSMGDFVLEFDISEINLQ